jgi:hypothetical protein
MGRMVVQRQRKQHPSRFLAIVLLVTLLPASWTASSSSMLLIHAFSSVSTSKMTSTARYMQQNRHRISLSTTHLPYKRHQQKQQPQRKDPASRKIRQSYSALSTASSSSSSEADPPLRPPLLVSPSSSSCGWMTKWMTGVTHPQRPSWAQPWMPTGWVRLRPSLQLILILLAYIFHMTILAQHSISFPIQLIPNDKGHFQNIGWDS